MTTADEQPGPRVTTTGDGPPRWPVNVAVGLLLSAVAIVGWVASWGSTPPARTSPATTVPAPPRATVPEVDDPARQLDLVCRGLAGLTSFDGLGAAPRSARITLTRIDELLHRTLGALDASPRSPVHGRLGTRDRLVAMADALRRTTLRLDAALTLTATGRFTRAESQFGAAGKQMARARARAAELGLTGCRDG